MGKSETAVNYAKLGLAVLPLNYIINGGCSCGDGGCGAPGKHPLIGGGVHSASIDPRQIREWWRRWPDANIGIACGEVSGIIVIDVDGEAGKASLSTLIAEIGQLPSSWTQVTGGGGRHLLFRHPGVAVKNKVGLRTCLDIRGDGGYIVAAPSNHISGNCYRWAKGKSPRQIALANLPAAWLELLQKENNCGGCAVPAAAAGQGLIPYRPVVFSEGERNDGLFRLGASLRARGLSDAALSAALQEENACRCQPPLSEREVAAIVTSVCRYQQGTDIRRILPPDGDRQYQKNDTLSRGSSEQREKVSSIRRGTYQNSDTGQGGGLQGSGAAAGKAEIAAAQEMNNKESNRGLVAEASGSQGLRAAASKVEIAAAAELSNQASNRGFVAEASGAQGLRVGNSKAEIAAVAAAITEETELASLQARLPLQSLAELCGDEIVGLLVSLEQRNSPGYFQAKELLAAQKCYRAAEMNKAVKMYKARLRRQNAATSEQQQLQPLTGLPGNAEFLSRFYLPPGWEIEGQAIVTSRAARGGGRELACPHLIFPSERLKNVESGSEKVRLNFYRDRRWRDVIVDKSMIAASKDIVALSDCGVQVTSVTAKALVGFLSDFETANCANLLLSESVGRAGWVDGLRFSPYSDQLAFDGEAAFKSVYEAICDQGSFAKWLKIIRRARVSLPLRALLAASFASPLLGLLEGQSFFVHLWGTRSGIGKSVALKAAISVWGNPDKLWRSFNSTAVGLERAAAFFHSLPMGVDELQTLNFDYNGRNGGGAKKLVYGLCQGQGKGRGTKQGGLERLGEWRLIFLSTGEQPLGEDLSTEGALARVIELYLQEGDYPAGLTPPELANAVNDNYGQAGRLYIARLTAWLDGQKTPLFELQQRFGEELQCPEYSGKQINALVFLALGDYLASRFVFDLAEQSSWEEAVGLARAVLAALNTRAQTDPLVQAWDWLLCWIAANEDHFGDHIGVPKWGVIKSQGFDKEIFILTTVLNEELKKAGFSPRAIVRGWGERGWLERDKDGSWRVHKWVGGVGMASCYVLDSEHTRQYQLDAAAGRVPEDEHNVW